VLIVDLLSVECSSLEAVSFREKHSIFNKTFFREALRQASNMSTLKDSTPVLLFFTNTLLSQSAPYIVVSAQPRQRYPTIDLYQQNQSKKTKP
jgi:hypothetical protein